MTTRQPDEGEGRGDEIGREDVGRIKPQRLTSDEIADAAQRAIDEAIKRNAPHEIVIVAILVSVAAVGIFLLLLGASDRRVELLTSGSSCALAVGWPVTRLFRMWQFNLALKTLPAIIRMSDNRSSGCRIIEVARSCSSGSSIA